MPSYIDYINYFWHADDFDSFSAIETRLYFTLLKLANRNRWQGEIVIGDKQLSAMVGVALNTFKFARSTLLRRELIRATIGGNGHRQKTRYQLRYQCRYQEPTPTLTPTPIYKNKTKTNNYYGTEKGFNISGSDFD
ncbi:MAG: hypothetical protein SNG27_06445 [Rikenellaceae bacterium]